MTWVLKAIAANWKTLVLVAVVLSVIGAFSSWRYGKGYESGVAAGNAKLLKMYEAGQKVVQRRDEAIQRNLEIYREDIARASRPVNRVYVCDGDELPKATSRTPGAGGQIRSSRIGQDITRTLQACELGLYQLNALIGVVK
jgi:hypothetical protein